MITYIKDVEWLSSSCLNNPGSVEVAGKDWRLSIDKKFI